MCFCSVLPNQEGLVEDGEVGESLACSAPCYGETQDPVWEESSSKARTLIFQRANSTFPKTCLGESHGTGL